MNSYYLPDLEAIPGFIDQVKSWLGPNKIILLNGNLGTGKTTLVAEILRYLKSEDIVSSPTFSLVNEYQTEQFPIYHFDLYRIKDLEELYDFGFEEYLDRAALVIIEWPEIAEPILPSNFLNLKLDYAEPKGRTIEVSENGLFS